MWPLDFITSTLNDTELGWNVKSMSVKETKTFTRLFFVNAQILLPSKPDNIPYMSPNQYCSSISQDVALIIQFIRHWQIDSCLLSKIWNTVAHFALRVFDWPWYQINAHIRLWLGLLYLSFDWRSRRQGSHWSSAPTPTISVVMKCYPGPLFVKRTDALVNRGPVCTYLVFWELVMTLFQFQQIGSVIIKMC